MGPYKVLIADDEPALIHGLCKYIDWEATNMELVGKAFDGCQALSFIQNNPVDLLITDMRMPRMDGLTLLEKASAFNPQLKFIIISAHDEFQYIKQALQFGIENYLVKPINHYELNETLQKTLVNLEQLDTKKDEISSEVLAFKYNILNRWVTGSIETFELYERAEILNINLSFPLYSVILIDIIEELKNNEKMVIPTKLLDNIRTKTTNLSNIHLFIDANFCIVIIICAQQVNHINQIIDQLTKDIQKICMQLSIQAFVSIGNIIDNIESLHMSYNNCLLWQNHKYLYPNQFSINSNAGINDIGVKKTKLNKLLFNFIQCIQQDNYPMAISCSSNYLALACSLTSRFDEKKTNLLPLLMNLLATVHIPGRNQDHLPDSFLAHLLQFSKLTNDESLTNWLHVSISTAINIRSKRLTSYHLLVRLTLELIHSKFSEQLSLKTIASDFDVTSAYLGQLFKSETGELFNDYLSNARMQVARELLSTTKFKIGEIVEKVGISNQSYFNRVFKKMYGISPTEFKRNK